jgi:predicted transcriptional regulator
MTTTNANEVQANDSSVIRLTAEIAAAFVSGNQLPSNEVPALLKSIHAALRGLVGNGGQEVRTELKPAVPVRKSITDDYIICLEDGKRLKMLKRYIRSRFSLSPEEYRAKWSLPADYPMVAPNYAAQRSAFAKKIGLGRTRQQPRSKRRGS